MIELLKRKAKSERFSKEGKRSAKRKVTQHQMLEGINALVNSEEGRMVR